MRFLHQAFITDTINHSLDVPSVDVRLYYIDDPDRKKFVNIITDYIRSKQSGKDAEALDSRFQQVEMQRERWGLRAEKAFQDCFNDGYSHVLMIGSRTPTIRSSMIKRAVKLLKESDAVFGPTPEGRYYVIGMSNEYRVRLSEFDWKSPTIYSEVSAAFGEQGLKWTELEIWYCVESPDEIELMVRDINQWRYEGDTKTARETEIIMERLLTKLG